MVNTVDQAYAGVNRVLASALNFVERKVSDASNAVNPIAEKVAPYSNQIIFGVVGLVFAPSTLFYLASSGVGAVVFKDKILKTHDDYKTSNLKERLDAMNLHEKILGSFVAAAVALAAYSILPVTLAVLAKVAITTGVGAFTGALFLNSRPAPDDGVKLAGAGSAASAARGASVSDSSARARGASAAGSVVGSYGS